MPSTAQKPVALESFAASVQQDGATLTMNGKPYTLGLEQFLALQREINAQSLLFVR